MATTGTSIFAKEMAEAAAAEINARMGYRAADPEFKVGKGYSGRVILSQRGAMAVATLVAGDQRPDPARCDQHDREVAGVERAMDEGRIPDTRDAAVREAAQAFPGHAPEAYERAVERRTDRGNSRFAIGARVTWTLACGHGDDFLIASRSVHAHGEIYGLATLDGEPVDVWAPAGELRLAAGGA